MRQIIGAIFSLLLLISVSPLGVTPVLAGEQLKTGEIKRLQNLSQALLVARVEKKRRIESGLAEDRNTVQQMEEALITLEREVQRASVHLSRKNRAVTQVTGKLSVPSVIEQSSIAAILDPVTNTLVTAPTQQQPQVQKLAGVIPPKSIERSIVRSRDSREVRRALTHAASAFTIKRRIFSGKVKKKTTGGSFMDKAQSAMVSVPTARAKSLELKRRKHLSTLIAEVDDSLRQMQLNGVNPKEIRKLRMRLKTKRKQSAKSKKWPTFTTITKHRR
ncbi:MAG: hypothetical protein ABW168_15960 [Sedimenticola sp.]